MTTPPHPFHLLQAPYRSLHPLTGGARQLAKGRRTPGTALIWHMRALIREEAVRMVEGRPGGMALVLVLPPVGELSPTQAFLSAAARVRPAAILPHFDALTVEELADVLRTPPDDLAAEVTEYLRWRGILIDRDTVQIIRRTLELSANVRSVSALARGIYMSRRALGRRFLTRGLPVPSHWLHFGRLLRTLLRLQTSTESVLTVARRLGYPDGFSLSNQMVRLTGYRPSDVRRYLGWEWFLEAWLWREADSGGLRPDYFASGAGPAGPTGPTGQPSGSQGARCSPDRRRRATA